MSDARGPGQKLLPVPVSERFLQELNAGVKKIGYSSRSQFIRDAIVEKLRSMGISISPELAFPPGRIGKGGRTFEKGRKNTKNGSKERPPGQSS